MSLQFYLGWSAQFTMKIDFLDRIEFRVKYGVAVSVKIYGERNTGTNALKKMIKDYSLTELNPGDFAEEYPLFNQALRPFSRLGLNSTIRRLKENTMSRKDSTKAWKHSATLFEDTEIRQCGLYVFTVRHPLSWLVGLQRRPYNYRLQSPPPADIEDFAQSQFPVLPHEKFLEGEAGFGSLTPIDLYISKINSYLRFQKQLDQLEIDHLTVRHEDIVLSQESVFQKIKPFLDDPKEFSELSQSTKERDTHLSDYKSYYGEELWREQVKNVPIESFDEIKSFLEAMDYR